MNQTDVHFERNIALLADENRFVRKKALHYFKECILNSKEVPGSSFPISMCVSNLSAALNDTIEVNRELAIQVHHDLLNTVQQISEFLPVLIPVLVKRLGQNEVIEPAEELRVETLRLISVILEKDIDVAPYMDDLLIIIQYSLSDNYHEMKKLACAIAQRLALKKIHRFYQASEIIMKPLLSNLLHQHSKVRLITVQTIGVVLIYGQGKLTDLTIVPLTQRLFDSASNVRRAVIEVVGTWLLDLPDRYSYQTKLLPLILSGFSDEAPDIRELTADFWHDIGCRELVYRAASRLLPALCRDLADWQVSTRTKAAALIPVLLMHLEELTTQHTQHLLTGLASGLTDAITRMTTTSSAGVTLLRLVPAVAFRGQPLPKLPLSVNQTDKEGLVVSRLPTTMHPGSAETTEALNVMHQILLAAQLVAALVESTLWWPLLKSCLDRCTESVAPASLAAHLFLLAAFISGAPPQQLVRPINPNDTDENKSTIRLIQDYLVSSDVISVVSFGAKAALMECNLATSRRLEEAVFIACGTPVEPSEVVGSDSDQCGDEERQPIEDAKGLFADLELRTGLFHTLIALAAVWSDGEAMKTDFGTGLLQLVDETTHRLAACERDYGRLVGDPDHINPLSPTIRMGESGQSVFNSNLLNPVAPLDVDRLYLKHMFKLFHLLEASQTESGGWHPRSVGLAIFSRCIQTAGPALLMQSHVTAPLPTKSASGLTLVLHLLERGCRLDRVLGGDSDKSPSAQADPLSMASEAELRFRGLVLLTKLTDHVVIRDALASPAMLTRCLTRLVLPACVWRAGRTAESMRKSAVTCLTALLAAATSSNSMDENVVDSRGLEEIKLDAWLCQHMEPVRKLLGPCTCDRDQQIIKNHSLSTRLPSSSRQSSLPSLSSASLSVLLARLGGLLEDDVEATRQMACLNLTLLFNGLLLTSKDQSDASQTSVVNGDGPEPVPRFLRSAAWLLPENKQGDTLPEDKICPLPNSVGDQVYRFYPNLIKRLNDAKDPIRLIVTETLNAWLRIVQPMLTCPTSPDDDISRQRTLNPVHVAIMDDFLQGVLPHLDDACDRIRAAVSRVLIRAARICPDRARTTLTQARDRHRSTDSCDQLIRCLDQLCISAPAVC